MHQPWRTVLPLIWCWYSALLFRGRREVSSRARRSLSVCWSLASNVCSFWFTLVLPWEKSLLLTVASSWMLSEVSKRLILASFLDSWKATYRRKNRVMTEPDKGLILLWFILLWVCPPHLYWHGLFTCFHTQLHSFFMVMWNHSILPQRSWFAYCLLQSHSSPHLAVEWSYQNHYTTGKLATS